MLANSVITAFISVVTFLGFFHQPTTYLLHRWLTRDKPVEPTDVQSIRENRIVELQAKLKEEITLLQQTSTTIDSTFSTTTTAIQTETTPLTQGTAKINVLLTPSSSTPSTMPLPTTTFTEDLLRDPSKTPQTDLTSALVAQINELHIILREQAQQINTFLTTTEDTTISPAAAIGIPSTVMPNPPTTTQLDTSTIGISIDHSSTAVTASTTKIKNRSEEIVELITHMETRNKRGIASTGSTTPDASILISTPTVEKQPEPLYTQSNAHTTTPSTSSDSTGYANASIDFNQAYTISVYSVLAVLSVLAILFGL